MKAGGGNSDLEGANVWLAVNEETITLLDVTSMQSVARVPYSAVVTFGGCQDDLMVVVNNCDIQGPGTQKMLFALPKPKVFAIASRHQKHRLTFFFSNVDIGIDAAHSRLHERSRLRSAQHTERYFVEIGFSSFGAQQNQRAGQRPQWFIESSDTSQCRARYPTRYTRNGKQDATPPPPPLPRRNRQQAPYHGRQLTTENRRRLLSLFCLCRARQLIYGHVWCE